MTGTLITPIVDEGLGQRTSTPAGTCPAHATSNWVRSFAVWAVAAVLLGAGTAMVYPTLLAAVDDVAHPAWRARSVGVYRLWRDGGFAVGALLTGLIADAFGILAAIWVVAVLTALSGVVVAVRMYETRSAQLVAADG
jgi:MFS family permease